MKNYHYKYLKYKKKYLLLLTYLENNRIEKNNYKSYVNDFFDQMQEKKYFNSYITKIQDPKLIKFFKILLKKKNSSYFPIKICNWDIDFIGIKNYGQTDLDKFWTSLEKPLSENKITKFIWPLVFDDFDNIKPFEIKDFIYFDGNIFEFGKNRGIKQIIKISDITQNNLYSNTFYYIFILLSKIKWNIQDQTQISGLKNINSFDKIQLELLELENLIENYTIAHEYDGDFIFDDNKIFFKYSPVSKFLFYYYIDRESHYLYLLVANVEKNGSKYKIFPITYSNILTNKYYESSLINFFNFLSKKFTEIIYGNNYNNQYSNIPDNFFHLHLTSIPNEPNLLLLSAHAKYENINIQTKIQDKNNCIQTYTFESKNNVKYKISRVCLNKLTNSIKKSRQLHNFYILIDLKSCGLSIYSMNWSYLEKLEKIEESDKINLFKYNLGINQNIFGKNFADLNYIEGQGVIITKVNLECEKYCINQKS